MSELQSVPARASRRTLRAGRRSGVSIVETAIALPLFLILLFGIVDVGRVLFAHTTLQHSVREAGRFAVTGRSLPGNGGPLTRVDSIVQTVVDDARPFALAPSDVRITSAFGGVGSAGGPGDMVTIAVTHHVTLITPLVGQFFPNGEYVIDVATTFKNEPFPPSQTN
jgi:hypothetical protein